MLGLVCHSHHLDIPNVEPGSPRCTIGTAYWTIPGRLQLGYSSEMLLDSNSVYLGEWLSGQENEVTGCGQPAGSASSLELSLLLDYYLESSEACLSALDQCTLCSFFHPTPPPFLFLDPPPR